MAELTLRDFAESLYSLVNTDGNENVASLTFPIDFQDVSAETLPKVNTYEALLANGDYTGAYEYRTDKDNVDLESLILDATKLNYLQTLMLTSYEFAKGEKNAANTSYDNSNTGLDANNLQDAIDKLWNLNQSQIKIVSSAPSETNANTIYMIVGNYTIK